MHTHSTIDIHMHIHITYAYTHAYSYICIHLYILPQTHTCTSHSHANTSHTHPTANTHVSKLTSLVSFLLRINEYRVGHTLWFGNLASFPFQRQPAQCWTLLWETFPHSVPILRALQTVLSTELDHIGCNGLCVLGILLSPIGSCLQRLQSSQKSPGHPRKRQARRSKALQ